MYDAFVVKKHDGPLIHAGVYPTRELARHKVNAKLSSRYKRDLEATWVENYLVVPSVRPGGLDEIVVGFVEEVYGFGNQGRNS